LRKILEIFKIILLLKFKIQVVIILIKL